LPTATIVPGRRELSDLDEPMAQSDVRARRRSLARVVRRGRMRGDGEREGRDTGQERRETMTAKKTKRAAEKAAATGKSRPKKKTSRGK
jgi:hypothetical protein